MDHPSDTVGSPKGRRAAKRVLYDQISLLSAVQMTLDDVNDQMEGDLHIATWSNLTPVCKSAKPPILLVVSVDRRPRQISQGKGDRGVWINRGIVNGDLA